MQSWKPFKIIEPLSSQLTKTGWFVPVHSSKANSRVLGRCKTTHIWICLTQSGLSSSVLASYSSGFLGTKAEQISPSTCYPRPFNWRSRGLNTCACLLLNQITGLSRLAMSNLLSSVSPRFYTIITWSNGGNWSVTPPTHPCNGQSRSSKQKKLYCILQNKASQFKHIYHLFNTANWCIFRGPPM